LSFFCDFSYNFVFDTWATKIFLNLGTFSMQPISVISTFRHILCLATLCYQFICSKEFITIYISLYCIFYMHLHYTCKMQMHFYMHLPNMAYSNYKHTNSTGMHFTVAIISVSIYLSLWHIRASASSTTGFTGRGTVAKTRNYTLLH
jgi:hypothetical protein